MCVSEKSDGDYWDILTRYTEIVPFSEGPVATGTEGTSWMEVKIPSLRERETERDREKERDRETERDRERQRVRERQRDRDRQIDSNLIISRHKVHVHE